MIRSASILILLAAAAPVLADVPVIYNQGFPEFNGDGRARKFANETLLFSNGFSGFSSRTGNWDNFLRTGSLSGSGNTGGGLGTPVQVVGSGDFNSSFSAGRSGPILTISAGSGAIRSIIPGSNLPNETSIASSGGFFRFSFEVTAPIISQWSGLNASLSRNGNLLPFGNASIAVLEPGIYTAEGQYAGSRRIIGTVEDETGDGGAFFNLKIGIPSPSAAAVLSIAVLGSCWRRRPR